MTEVEGPKVRETPQCSLANIGDGGVSDGECGEIMKKTKGWTKC